MLAATVANTASAQVWSMQAWGCCPLWVTRATGLGQLPSVSDCSFQLTCVAPVIIPLQSQRIKFWTINYWPLNQIKTQNKLLPGLAAIFFNTSHLLLWTTISCFYCLYSTRILQKKTKAFQVSFKNDGGMEFNFNFCLLSSCMNFPPLWSIHERSKSRMDKDKDAPIRKNMPEAIHKMHVTMIKALVLSLYQYTDYFHLHVPTALTLPLSWTKTTWRTQQSESTSPWFM
jgi:hypothetical protein